MNYHYCIYSKNNLSSKAAGEFTELLSRQGRIIGDIKLKWKGCNNIVIAYHKNKLVGIGAIKKATKSVFLSDKADAQELDPIIDFELGYLYTHEDHRNKGISKAIINKLLDENKRNNLMATTEISNLAMRTILEDNNFVMKGKEWQSSIDGQLLCLYVKVGTKS